MVCVGGDGMFSEIVHGLVTRTQTDNGVDQNQPDAELVPCYLHIGIIPAGEFLDILMVYEQREYKDLFFSFPLKARCARFSEL